MVRESISGSKNQGNPWFFFKRSGLKKSDRSVKWPRNGREGRRQWQEAQLPPAQPEQPPPGAGMEASPPEP
jgi:hypothetical protein